MGISYYYNSRGSSMKSKTDQQELSKPYVWWKQVSVFILCAGLIFLIEALTRLDLKAFGGLKFIELTYLVPFVACLSCWCVYMAKDSVYSKKGLRWVNASIVLLGIAVFLLFEEIAAVGSDVFTPFNFFALALTSSMLCSLSAICSNYADKYRGEASSEMS